MASEPPHTEPWYVSRLATRKSGQESKGEEIEENEQKGEARPDSAGFKGGGTPSIAVVARGILRREGIHGFYRGVGYSMGQSGIEKAAYFYGYGWLKAAALRMGGGSELGTAADLALGYLAEAFHLPFTLPIEVRDRHPRGRATDSFLSGLPSRAGEGGSACGARASRRD